MAIMEKEERAKKGVRGWSREFTPPTDEAAKRYLLDKIPGKLWIGARAKAKREGLSMRGLILTLLQRYVDAA